MTLKTTAVQTKGGVTKSAACVNLAAIGARLGYKVLLCDFDQQATATANSGVRDNPDINLSNFSSARLFFEEVPVSELILTTDYGYDIIPATAKIYDADAKIQSTPAGEMVLHHAFAIDKEKLNKYDLIICDTQGAATRVLKSVLLMVDDYFVSNTADEEAVEQLDTVEQVIQVVNKSRKWLPDAGDLEMRAHFFNAANTQEISFGIQNELLAARYGKKHLEKNFVVRSADHRKASMYHMPLVCFAEKSRATDCYRGLFSSMFNDLAQGVA